MPKISQYTAVSAPADSDVYVVVQGGVTKKVTYAQIKAGIIGDADALVYKGVLDCAAAPNYPAADAGHVYKISVAGNLGGAAGPVVQVGDVAICSVDGSAAGTHAAVGANWNILQTNLDIEAATAANDFLVGGSSPFGWVRKTLAQVKTILGLGGTIPAPTAISDFMVAAGSPLDWAKKTLSEVLAILMPAPGPIGGTTPAEAAFTTLKATTGALSGGVLVSDSSGNLTYAPLAGQVNYIGQPGKSGFGVGICPHDILPSGMTPMSGCFNPSNDNYGNYQFTDGSIMVWIPKFYYRIAHASNPTYGVHGVNSIDIKGTDAFGNTTEAIAAGYALHRAFIDGGVEKLGFFVDKYKCSKVANGSGFTAASVLNGLPLSSAAAHNPFADLTGGVNYYYGAIDLAHRRDGVNGAVNASSIFFCCSQFVRAALAMLSLAHGQAATSTTNCAWYHATYNYPKGCNNNALADTDDTTVIWQTDGYSNCGKTGSAGYGGGAGNVFAKSTHNGQNCGVADLNGLMYEISIGLTCVATTKAIEAISKAASAEITITNHGLATGDMMQIGTAITQADWVGLNSKVWPIVKTGDNTFTVAFNSSGFAVAYDAGDPGTCVLGKFYAAKQATAMKTFTNGVSAATDHWGATGGAAMMDIFTPPFGDGDVFAQRFGSATNQVLSEATSGAGYLLTGLGIPKDAGGMDTTGTNLFGKDYMYCCVIDTMCRLACAYWSSTTLAGVWYADWSSLRDYSSNTVGFRAACYHA